MTDSKASQARRAVKERVVHKDLAALLALLALLVLQACPVNPDRQVPRDRADPQALPEEVVPGF